MKKKNILIYWMRWTWKSTVWKALAKSLKRDFIDLDNYIEQAENNKIITIVEKNGMEYFRDLEYKYLKEILDISSNTVISLWWGTVIFERNIREINKYDSLKIYLYSSIESIIKRVTDDEKNLKNRPCLTWKNIIDELQNIYSTREEVYENNYDLKIENNWNISTVVEKIKDNI